MRDDGEHGASAIARALGELARGDRAEALLRVLAVELDVVEVVDEVAGAGDRAEGDEGERSRRATASSSSNLPEKSRPAKTSRFLIHSCGRTVLIAARSGERAARPARRPSALLGPLAGQRSAVPR